jgi:hypothetical protein
METLLLNDQQLACLLNEAHIINTKKNNINVLAHSIEHRDFGIASIIESTAGGVLIYEQHSRDRMG